MTSSARIILILSLSAVAASGGVDGKVVRVGYPSVGGSVQGRDMIRIGSWVPVIVDLTVTGQTAFDGWVRISQPDKDGDLCYDMQKVQLLPDSGLRSYTLYVTANPPSQRSNAFAVEVLDSDNRRVQVETGDGPSWTLTPSEPPEALSADSFLILSVSSRTAGKVAFTQAAEAADQFARTIRVAHIAPKDLPSRWLGLDVVDAVVWDEADPSELLPAQLDALLEWTRQGGLLMIAAGKTADAVARTTALASVLPVRIGPVKNRTAFRRLRRRFLGFPLAEESSGAPPVPTAECTLRPGATVVVSVDKESEGIEGVSVARNYTPLARDDKPAIAGWPLVARTRVGRGRVVFVAASLRDLLSENGDTARFFKRTLELRDAREEAGGQEERLFAHVDSWVGFSQIGALYLVSAMALAFGYVLLTTAGAWQFLKRKQWQKHSWSIFAVTSIAAIALTVIGVQAVRGGVGKTMMQLSVVDGEAGENAAYATAYFGLKTSMFGMFDVWAPDDYPQVTTPSLSSCFLKPLPSTNVFGTGATFVDPGRYQLGPSRAELVGVPIRGTVKQFESRWHGDMPGRLAADLQVIRPNRQNRYDVRISGSSTITNTLGADLHRCFLIYAAQDIYLVEDAGEIGNRADRMYILPLPPLADGASCQPGELFYEAGSGAPLNFAEWNKNDDKEDKYDLDRFLSGCTKSFNTMADTFGRHEFLRDLPPREISLLLTSLLSEYLPVIEPNMPRMGFASTFTADGFRHLDVSHFVDTRTALFIGFSTNPGPVTLCTGGDGAYRAVSPSAAMTMYRILIPLNTDGLQAQRTTEQP